MSCVKLFSLENEIGTDTKFSKTDLQITDSSIGICVALSSLWCSNVLHKGIGQSRPDYLRASLLQGLYERAATSSGADLSPLFDSLSIKTTSAFSMPGKQAIQFLRTRSGLFMLRYPGHAMAAQVGTAGNYFLDPERGLYHCSSGSALETQIWKLYKHRKNKNWVCQQVVAG